MSVIQLSSRYLKTLKYAQHHTNERNGRTDERPLKETLCTLAEYDFYSKGLHLFRLMILPYILMWLSGTRDFWMLLPKPVPLSNEIQSYLQQAQPPCAQTSLSRTVRLSMSSVPQHSWDLIHLTTWKVSSQQFTRCWEHCYLFQLCEKLVQVSWQQTPHTLRQIIRKMTFQLSEQDDFWSSSLSLQYQSAEFFIYNLICTFQRRFCYTAFECCRQIKGH